MALTNDDLQAIAALLQPINNRLDNIESEITALKTSNEKIESEVAALKFGQRDLKKEMREVKDKVSDTYELALEAWGQSTENRTWLEQNQAIG